MTETENMLTILSEECAEVSHRASKILRFGLQEIQPGQVYDNAERLSHEMSDLIAVYEMLTESIGVPTINRDAIIAKKAKVLKYLEYSKQCGRVSDEAR